LEGEPMNPIQHFESCAEKMWRAQVSPAAKGENLRTLSRTIDQYVYRIDAVDASEDVRIDSWQLRRLQRAKAYLAQLSEDTRTLAEECHPLATEDRATEDRAA